LICDLFTHVGIGCTGGGTIRGLFSSRWFGDRITTWKDTSGHRSLSWMRELGHSPSFTFVRNPWDWYIAYYIIQLRYHRWRGTFEDWFFRSRGVGFRFADLFEEMTGPDGCEYVGRFENYQADLKWIFQQVKVIPGVMTEEEYDEVFPMGGWTTSSRPWIEGYEQWFRDNMFTHRMLEAIGESDDKLAQRFGYTFQDRYYHPGGLAPSCHDEVGETTWEQEKHLASWVEWAPGPPGVFVKD